MKAIENATIHTLVYLPLRVSPVEKRAMQPDAPKRFFEFCNFLPNFDHSILDSGHVIRARDVILGGVLGVVQFTMLVVLNKKILI